MTSSRRLRRLIEQSTTTQLSRARSGAASNIRAPHPEMAGARKLDELGFQIEYMH